MAPEALTQLVAGLFSAITALTGEPQPTVLPEIHAVPHSQVEEMVCQRACRVRAFYVPQLGVFYDADLDVERDLYARSILLHELVHHMQSVTAKYDDLDPCSSTRASEEEAYQVQNEYLRVNGSSNPIRFTSLRIACPGSSH